jgi:hypothetical protein
MVRAHLGGKHWYLALALCLLASLAACGSSRPAKPDPNTQQTISDVGTPDCRRLVVSAKTQERTSSWTWSKAKNKWVQKWGAWKVTDERDSRPATAKDCLHIIDKIPTAAVLPDLRLKELDRCGKGDLDATGGDCFMILNPAPHDEDYPKLTGRKLLKFPVITINVGAGPSEIIADRSAKDAEDWKAYQTFYTAQGKSLGSSFEPEVEFYFAGDGHNHWHVRDFDQYEILDAGGKIVRRAEKHGYCMQDNTTYTPMVGKPGVPPDPGVYLDETSCGKGLPNALTIIHGLSKGWGDTYPTTLPDQAVDITGLPDGTYTVDVHADFHDLIMESNEDNNDTSMQITIKGNEVLTHPSTVRGGLD